MKKSFSLRISRMSQIHPSVIESIEFWYYFRGAVLGNLLLFHSESLLKDPLTFQRSVRDILRGQFSR